MICYKCGNDIPSDSAYCPFCGIKLFVTCPKCGHVHSSQYPICNKCGTNRVELAEKQVQEQIITNAWIELTGSPTGDTIMLDKYVGNNKDFPDSIVMPSGVTAFNGFKYKNSHYSYDPEAKRILSSLKCFILSASVTEITELAFLNCAGLKCITIPDRVTKIGESAFWDCTSLTNIVIPNSVTCIGTNAFARCTALHSIIIPDSVTLVGRGAFKECTSLSQITLSNRLKEIRDDTFSGCSSLTKIEIPSNVKLISGMVYRVVDDEVGCFTYEAGAFL